MPDAFDEQAVLVAAEQAAAEGDAQAAEGHLRQLLNLQTTRVGTQHPDVASTLHNLAVVCERVGRVGEAETLYRQAFAVAAATLPPGDALVVRCREDLHAFLDSRGMPVEAPTATPMAAPSLEPAKPARRPAASAPAPSRPSPPVLMPPPPVADTGYASSSGGGSRSWIAALIAVGVLGAIGVAWSMRGDAPTDAPAAATVERLEPSALTPAPATPAAAPAAPVAATPAGTPPPAETSAPVAAPVAEPGSSTAETRRRTAGVEIVAARLCDDLTPSGAWRCSAPPETILPGRLYYFTQLEVEQPTAVTHRWYHEDAVVQSVTLRIRPNGGRGFRTYSRQTVVPRQAGAWRVELRAPDGTVIGEERFTVQASR